MTLMQLALLTRIYHQVAPEDGDGIDGVIPKFSLVC